MTRKQPRKEHRGYTDALGQVQSEVVKALDQASSAWRDPGVKRMVMWVAGPLVLAILWVLVSGRASGVLFIIVVGEIIASLMVLRELNAWNKRQQLGAITRRQRYQTQRRHQAEAEDRAERGMHPEDRGTDSGRSSSFFNRPGPPRQDGR